MPERLRMSKKNTTFDLLPQRGPLRKYVYLCRSDAPRCSFRSNCQVKAVLHLQTIRKNERDF